MGDWFCDIKSLVRLKERKKELPWTSSQRSAWLSLLKREAFSGLGPKRGGFPGRYGIGKPGEVGIHPGTVDYIHDLFKVNRILFPVCLCNAVRCCPPLCVTD